MNIIFSYSFEDAETAVNGPLFKIFRLPEPNVNDETINFHQKGQERVFFSNYNSSFKPGLANTRGIFFGWLDNSPLERAVTIQPFGQTGKKWCYFQLR